MMVGLQQFQRIPKFQRFHNSYNSLKSGIHKQKSPEFMQSRPWFDHQQVDSTGLGFRYLWEMFILHSLIVFQ